jgi:hypothetical protein
VLSDELADNLEAVRDREAVQPCLRQQIAYLRKWTEQQSQSGDTALPPDIGNPGMPLILDSVWDVSKSGQVVAKIPLEVRRRYAAVYDLFERFATVQQLEREVWFSLSDYGGLSKVTPAEAARLNGLLSRAEIYDEALSRTVRAVVSDLAKLKVEPSEPPDLGSVRQRAICQRVRN